MAAKRLNKLAKLALASAAVVVALLAVSIGGFRLLAAELPRHQADLQAWVNARLGLRLEFARVDAHWGWRGPELTFRQAWQLGGTVMPSRSSNEGIRSMV